MRDQHRVTRYGHAHDVPAIHIAGSKASRFNNSRYSLTCLYYEDNICIILWKTIYAATIFQRK